MNKNIIYNYFHFSRHLSDHSFKQVNKGRQEKIYLNKILI